MNGPSNCVTLHPLQLPQPVLEVHRHSSTWGSPEGKGGAGNSCRALPAVPAAHQGTAGLGSLPTALVPLAVPPLWGSSDHSSSPGMSCNSQFFYSQLFYSQLWLQPRWGGGSRRLWTGQLSRLGRGWPAPPLLLSSQGSPCCSCASLSRPLIICCYLKRQQNQLSTASFLHLSLLALFFFFFFFSLVLSLFRKLPRSLCPH